MDDIRPAIVYDADSHVMEPLDWLDEYLDPSLRGRLPKPPVDQVGGKLAEFLRLAEKGAHEPEYAVSLEGDVLGGPKGFEALGAFNSAERSRVLDLLDIQAQLVFSTFSLVPALVQRDLDLVYGGAEAHNRAITEFCSDRRLIAVGAAPLNDAARAVETATAAIELGCGALLVQARPAGAISPGHLDLDPFWRLLEEANIPFMLHIGFQAVQIRKEYSRNGRPAPVDFIGSGEGVRAKDYPGVHYRVEEFLTSVIFDGVLDRFPRLMGGIIEFGADWVPSFMRRMDHTAKHWAKSSPELRELKRRPSEQITEQLRFTPTNFEDVAGLIRESNDRLYCFSTDYPHVEGGKDPFGRFNTNLAETSEETRTRFYERNFADLFAAGALTG